jgi:regulatory protein YycH of two-component signal transduction system YycFG
MRGRYTDNLDDNNTMHFRVTIRANNSEQSRVVYILPNEDDQILTRMTIARNMLHELEKLCKDKDEDEEMSLSLEMMCE